jgi:hypothetical protein
MKHFLLSLEGIDAQSLVEKERYKVEVCIREVGIWSEFTATVPSLY